MPSRYGITIAQIFSDIETFLAAELFLQTPFQDDCTVPNERYGICDYNSWDTDRDEFGDTEQIKFTLWIISSYDSFTACRNGLIQLSADVRSILPAISQKIDQRGVLLGLSYPPTVSATKRAPVTRPNTQSGHLWIGDITASIAMNVAIGKSMCGEHL